MTFDRLPPQNLEAEQAAIGAMLLDRDAIARAKDTLKPAHFYRDTHRLLTEHIYRMYDNREPVDIITIAEALGPKLETIGGMLYLTTLMSNTPTAAGIMHYAGIVREKAQLRELIRLGDNLQEAAYTYHGDDLAPVINKYAGMLDEIRDTGQAAPGNTQLADWLAARMARLQEEDNRQEEGGVTLPVACLNEIVNPLRPGQLIYIAGRPGMGKSVFALGTGLAAALAHKHVLFYSLEMDPEDLAIRALSAYLEMPSWNWKTRDYRIAHKDTTYTPMELAIQTFRRVDMDIRNPEKLTPARLMQEARAKKRHGGLDLVVIDYFGFMGPNERHSKSYENATALSRELKQAATALHVPLICVAQLSRSCEERSPKRPAMSDLRDSGGLEQDADGIWLLYRPGYYRDEKEYKAAHCPDGVKREQFTEIIIAKQREGETGRRWVRFDLEMSLMKESNDVK